jgi:hypothetical protein
MISKATPIGSSEFHHLLFILITLVAFNLTCTSYLFISGTESRVIGALAYGTGYGALSWTEPALDVVEVCRPCVLWDCDGRTYAIDCYLKLLVRLCHIYDTRGGVKTIKAGASQDQILNETRLRNLQLQLIKDLREVVIYIYIELGYGALQSTRTLCALRSIINFKSEMIDSNRSI